MTHFTRFNRVFYALFLLFFSLFSSMSYASVAIRTGAFNHQTFDIEGVDRTYSSSFTKNGLFGKKWKTVYDNRLEISKENGVLIVFDAISENHHEFRINSENIWLGSVGSIAETDNGFSWDYKSSLYVFNQQGLLIEYHADEYKIYTLEYDDEGYLSHFGRYDNTEYEVKTNDDGAVVSFINSDRDRINTIEYIYRDDLLINVIEKDNEKHLNTTEYRYNDDDLLTFIGDGNGYATDINYETYNNQARVSEYKDHSSITHYDYKLIYDDLHEKHFSVTTNEKVFDTVYKNRYEFIDVYDDGKFSYTRKFKKYVNNKLVFDGEYLKKCMPSSVVRNGKKTTTTYDNDGHILSKETAIGIINYQYNNHGKITYIHRILKNEPDSEKWASYSYNNNNNLVSAKNSEGRTLNLEYDNNENIIVMSTQDKTLYISYNKIKKPGKITVNGVGTVNITYDEHGEIVSVDAGDAGHKLALEITRAFQDMLSIISAATKNNI